MDLPLVGLVTVTGPSGFWTFQSDILHYMRKHGWKPPERFANEIPEFERVVCKIPFGQRGADKFELLSERRNRVYYDGKKRRYELSPDLISHLMRLMSQGEQQKTG